MNLEARKISLIKEFLSIDNEIIISALENFSHKNKSDTFEGSLKPMSVEDFNREIDKALEDEKDNRIISVLDLKKQIQKWS